MHTERAFFLYAILAWLNNKLVIIRTIHSNFLFDGFIKCTRSKYRKLIHQLNVKQISIGQSVHDNELERFGNSTGIIANWCDLDYLRPPTIIEKEDARRRLGLLDENIIISIGNCSPVKNHDLILRSLKLLKGKVKNLVYLHLGEEDPALRERKFAEELGISDMVNFC